MRRPVIGAGCLMIAYGSVLSACSPKGQGSGAEGGAQGAAAGAGNSNTGGSGQTSGTGGGGGMPIGSGGASAGRTLSVATYRDKLEGGWIGEMAGMSWGGPTEFRYIEKIIPVSDVPDWTPDMVNDAYNDDNLYVQMPFLQAIKDHGIFADWGTFGDYFMNTSYQLWHANWAGRDNLQGGLKPPDSGNYANNPHADDLDFQIESGWIGALAPGQPETVLDFAFRAGHVMNYGDGVYGGLFVSTMVSTAFFASSPADIVESGRRALPEGSKYRKVIDDTIRWHGENPNDWTYVWQKLEDTYEPTDRCPDGFQQPFDIDATLHGAYVTMGLLYGGGDMEQSMLISMRAGQDSDCDIHSVGEIMGTWLGRARVPDKFKSAVDASQTFQGSSLSLQNVFDLCVEKAREIVTQNGGSVAGSGADETWNIVGQTPLVPLLEQWPLTHNDPPTLDAGFEVGTGRSVSFHAQASDGDGISGYQWHFGDLGVASGDSVTHVYSKAGTYTAIAFASDKIGNSSFRQFSVNVP